MSDIRADSAGVHAERKMGAKRTSAKLNPVHKQNRFTDMDFPDYEYEPYPKMIPVPMPTVQELSGDGKTKITLPDEDELPVELRRKIREWEDDHGQIHQSREADKAWVRRCARLWPMHYPIADDAREEAQIKKDWGLSNIEAAA